MRTNQYKQSILNTLQKGHLFTLAELQKAIPEANHSTFFRNVEQLTADGVVQKIVLKKNSVAYEIHKGHGHFICDGCDEVSKLSIPETGLKRGYVVNDFVAHGTCASCK
jgi:Fe2+ or Zn2+ uptake regulation protein